MRFKDILDLASYYIKRVYCVNKMKNVNGTYIFELVGKDDKYIIKTLGTCRKLTNDRVEIKTTHMFYLDNKLDDLIEITTTIERKEICDGIIVLPEGGDTNG